MKPTAERRKLVDRKPTAKLNISRQCMLLSLHRSGLYYRPKGESKLNLELMRQIDEHYLLHPEKGAVRMHTWLTKDKGYQVNQKRVERLYYDVMGRFFQDPIHLNAIRSTRSFRISYVIWKSLNAIRSGQRISHTFR